MIYVLCTSALHNILLTHIPICVFTLRSEFTSIRLRNTYSWRLIKPLRLMVPTFWSKGVPPHNVTLYKGCNQVALTRAFVVFFLFSQPSRDLVEWLADTMIPDEYIWPTLNHNRHLHAPGSYKGKCVDGLKRLPSAYNLYNGSARSKFGFRTSEVCGIKQVELLCPLLKVTYT